MGEGVGGSGHFLQGAALPSHKDGADDDENQHNAQRGAQIVIGQPVQQRAYGGGGDGDDDDAHGVTGIFVGDGHGHQVSGVVIEAADHAGGGVPACLNHLVQILLVDLQPQMLAAEGGIGAQHHPALGIADDDVRPGQPGGHIQIDEKIPSLAVAGDEGGGQPGDGIGVLIQPAEGEVRQIIVGQLLEDGAQQDQRQQQNQRGRQEITSKGGFHTTSNL